MTNEERIEALTQSVELLAEMQKDNERRIEVMIENINRLGEAHNELGKIVERIGIGTDNLIVLAHDHEMRLRAIEGA